MILATPSDSENDYVLSANMWSFRKLSRSASAVSGVMIVYGFVLGERLNLVMHEEILSIYMSQARFESAFFWLSIDNNTHRVHLTSLPLLLQGRDFDVAQEITTLAKDPVCAVRFHSVT